MENNFVQVFFLGYLGGRGTWKAQQRKHSSDHFNICRKNFLQDLLPIYFLQVHKLEW